MAPAKTDVFAALVRKCGFEIVQEKETASQLRFMGRLHPDRWNFFVPVIHQLLVTSNQPDAGWTCDISKQYLVRDNKVLYGWRFIFQAKSGGLPDQYARIIAIINSAPSPDHVELQSQLLPGYRPGDVRGGFNAKGKGSGSAGSLPLALTRGR